jgi:hypothetical protein
VGQLLYRARSTLRCAISAIVPQPLLAWLARLRVQYPASTTRMLQSAAAGTNNGTVAVIARSGATLAVIAAAAAPVISTQAAGPHHERAASNAAIRLSPSLLSTGASDPLSAFPHPQTARAPSRPAAHSSGPHATIAPSSSGVASALEEPAPTAPQAGEDGVAEAAAQRAAEAAPP